MKKFQFTLEKLLDYKDQVLEKEKNDLAFLHAEKNTALEHEQEIMRNMKDARDDFNYRAQKGISPMEMFIFKEYHNSLRLSLEETKQEIEKLDVSIEKQTGVVTEASKEVKSLEKLEEKQLEDYRFRLTKADEAFIEEYVNSASVRAALAELG
ncbi:MAG: flagellar export protein FliJ [Ruminococcus sp.]|nr:flagellar export protein FliJ [Ruminococcus sp.]